jgi:hypothetical protein
MNSAHRMPPIRASLAAFIAAGLLATTAISAAAPGFALACGANAATCTPNDYVKITAIAAAPAEISSGRASLIRHFRSFSI